MNTPEKMISVILPVYNAEAFLQQTVDSVLAQTYENFELVMVDDGSTDRSYQIMCDSAARDSRVRVLKNQHNQGVAASRNNGIRRAAGSYIALLDSDDIWRKDKLQRQMELLEQENAQFIYSSYDFIDEKNTPILRPHPVPKTLDYRMLLKENCILCSSVLAEAELFRAHPFRTDYYHEDFVLWLELFSLPVTAAGSPELLVHYRISGGSRSYHKGNAALERWRIYRHFLKMNPVKSAFYFAQYALNGVKKYYI